MQNGLEESSSPGLALNETSLALWSFGGYWLQSLLDSAAMSTWPLPAVSPTPPLCVSTVFLRAQASSPPSDWGLLIPYADLPPSWSLWVTPLPTPGCGSRRSLRPRLSELFLPVWCPLTLDSTWTRGFFSCPLSCLPQEKLGSSSFTRFIFDYHQQ